MRLAGGVWEMHEGPIIRPVGIAVNTLTLALLGKSGPPVVAVMPYCSSFL